MYKDQSQLRGENDGIIALVKETADGFGHLIADHIKLARLELVSDVKAYGRQVGLIAVIVPFLFVGYGLVCLGLAALLAPWLGQAGALFLVGGAHIAIGALAIAAAAGRLRRVQPMHDTAQEVGRSMATFTPAHVSHATNGSNGSGSNGSNGSGGTNGSGSNGSNGSHGSNGSAASKPPVRS
jgi:Putative Actinobacterial Holin-X, holin superfamily III